MKDSNNDSADEPSLDAANERSQHSMEGPTDQSGAVPGRRCRRHLGIVNRSDPRWPR
jgi:hypothetical protein